MEIYMKIMDEKSEINFIDSYFVMVARNTETNLAEQVNSLKLENSQDLEKFEIGANNNKNRKEAKRFGLLSHAPKKDETVEIHNKFVNTLDSEVSFSSSARKLQTNQIWMEEAKLKSVLVAMPQHRNVHGKLFGGHIIRKAFELSFANIKISAAGPIPVKCIAIDDISFIHPVKIGSIFLLSSQVVYSKKCKAVIRVYASVTDPLKQETKMTNTFYCIFESQDQSEMPEVVPKTYGESLLYIDGKRIYDRHFENY